MNRTLVFTTTITVISVPVTVKDDSIIEQTETFAAQLSLQSLLSNVTIQPETTQVTILDSDTAAGEFIYMTWCWCSVLGDFNHPGRLLEHLFGYRVVYHLKAGGRMLRGCGEP